MEDKTKRRLGKVRDGCGILFFLELLFAIPIVGQILGVLCIASVVFVMIFGYNVWCSIIEFFFGPAPWKS